VMRRDHSSLLAHVNLSDTELAHLGITPVERRWCGGLRETETTSWPPFEGRPWYHDEDVVRCLPRISKLRDWYDRQSRFDNPPPG
jgi:hypothetical protein